MSHKRGTSEARDIKGFDYRVVTDGDFSVRILRAYDVFEGRVVARADMWV